MKMSKQYTHEKLIVISPKSFNKLRKIIEDRYDKLGAGTKQNPIDFNDIDVSNIYSFYNYNKNKGIFDELREMGIEDGDVVRVNDFEFEYMK